MPAAPPTTPPFLRCPSCGSPASSGAKHCGKCGAELTAPTIRGESGEPPPASRSGWPRAAAVLLALATITALAAAFFALFMLRGERRDRESDRRVVAQRLVQEGHLLSTLTDQNAALAKRLTAAEHGLSQQRAGVAPLASRVLKSVYTVETSAGLGTGWVAWKSNGETFLITANHVVADAISYGDRDVKVRQKARKWLGTVTVTDSTNDLAVIRVEANLGPPLWQHPDTTISPIPGDTLLLVGSPYGLEGTVTSGVVSRVSYDKIQTDAAANPGNSGGPAVDANGDVVGVLLSGGAENINFAVPIQRACVLLRHC